MLKKYIQALLSIIIIALAHPCPIQADEVSEAVAAAKKSPKNQKLNRRAAEALLHAGEKSEAIEYFLKSDNRGNLDAAELCFELYDFERAGQLLDKYLAKRTKEQKIFDSQYIPQWSEDETDYTDVLRHRINLGLSMLDRVEKIAVIDSVNVPAEDFLNYYRLARTAGRLRPDTRVERLLPRGWLASQGLSTISPAAFESEAGDYVMFAATDEETANSAVYETYQLADGQWIQPEKVFDYASIFGKETGITVDFPFLMPDGVTLYFAADGEDSLGGLDIFVSRRGDDSYLQPSNAGMPYNSPANDYMLAIDEVNGTGWWVSDRNGLADSVTVYTFIPSADMRVNYPADTPGLADIARLTSISLTHDGVNQSAIAHKNTDAAQTDNGEDEVELSLPDGRVITSLQGLSNAAARKAMTEYVKAYNLLAANCRQLEQLRARYGSGDHSLSFRILSLEEEVDRQSRQLITLRNEAVRAEMGDKMKSL
ncbi:MAG: hypothetical protein K2K68_04255 [Duncaniella sp.]|nr:hypothetical protein [Duncaniella sp.]